MTSLEQLIQRIEHDGQITEEELRDLHRHMMWDGKVTQEEKALFKRLITKASTRQLRMKHSPEPSSASTAGTTRKNPASPSAPTTRRPR